MRGLYVGKVALSNEIEFPPNTREFTLPQVPRFRLTLPHGSSVFTFRHRPNRRYFDRVDHGAGVLRPDKQTGDTE